MQLQSYLAKHNLSVSEFAVKIGVSRQAAWRYILGQRTPRAQIIHRIESETDGAVTATDFFPTPKREGEAA